MIGVLTILIEYKQQLMVTWKTGDYFGGMIDDDAVGMAPFTNMPADVAAFAGKIKEGIKNGKYHAFTGPIVDNTGKLQLKDGEIAR